MRFSSTCFNCFNRFFSPVLTGLIQPDFPLKTCTFPIRSECQISRDQTCGPSVGMPSVGGHTCGAGPTGIRAPRLQPQAALVAELEHKQEQGTVNFRVCGDSKGGGEQGWASVTIPVAALSLGWLSRLCACVGGSLCVCGCLCVFFVLFPSGRESPLASPQARKWFTVFPQSPLNPHNTSE